MGFLKDQGGADPHQGEHRTLLRPALRRRAERRLYDELEETLILGDMGVETTMKAVEELRRRVKAEKIKDMEGARACLRRVLTDMLQVGSRS